MNKRIMGAQYEELAVSYLEKEGYQILEQNFRCRMGEIDLIAKDGNYLVFIEVKYRSDTRKGNALEAVNVRKQRVISKVAAYYMMLHQSEDSTPCRFDVVGITGEAVEVIKDAFEYQGW